MNACTNKLDTKQTKSSYRYLFCSNLGLKLQKLIKVYLKMNKMKQVLQLLLLVSRKSDHQTNKDKTK